MDRLSAYALRSMLLIAMLIGTSMFSSTATAQVRTKKPDREVYQAPVIGQQDGLQAEQKLTVADQKASEGLAAALKQAPQAKSVASVNTKPAAKVKPAKWGAPLEDTELLDIPPSAASRAASTNVASSAAKAPIAAPSTDSRLRAVSHAEAAPTGQRSPLRDPQLGSGKRAPTHQPVGAEEVWLEPPVTHAHGAGDVIYEHSEVANPIFADSNFDNNLQCDAMYDGGCDSMASRWGLFGCSNGTLSMSSERWFWSAELLLMHRSGTRVPVLVTTTVDTTPDAETAGEIGQADTRILNGNDAILKDLTAGGRFTVGTWLDDCQNRSLVFRGWFAGEETHDFATNQTVNSVIARPFFNVSDGQAAEQDTQLVAFPTRSDGAISVRADSEVFGGDASVRQEWWNSMGLNIDLLYGYQYMRLDESLGISSLTTSLDANFAPVGSTLAINDSFDAQNEFHGGQLGIASLYREGCWSLRSLAKVGFGSLQREGRLTGSTVSTIDGNADVDPQGLFVRDTNSGRVRDNTFGWVPELDFTLGWHRYPRFDTTIGYHIVAMTDALQPGEMIDSTLSVNLVDNPTGRQSPARTFRYDTFYVQGIHFGLAYIY